MTMEITDYLALAKRRWILLLGIPLLAAAIAAAVLLLAPTKYTATATVNAPALVGGSTGQYTGSQAVTQFVSSFQSTAASAPVDRAVMDKTSLQPGQITDGLTVAQVGGSSAITITFVSTTKGVPTGVVSTIASTTLGQMFDSQVTLAQSRVDESAKQVAAANTAINTWGAKNGMVDPNKVYQSQLERLNALQQSQASLKAQGNATAASALNGTIADVSNKLKDFGPKIAEFSNLVATRDSAVTDLTSARQSLAQAKTQQTAADPAQVVFIGNERAADRADELLTVGLPVIGAGIFLALALIAVLELLRSNRQANMPREPRDENREESAVGERERGPVTLAPSTASATESGRSTTEAIDPSATHEAVDASDRADQMDAVGAVETEHREGGGALVGTERS